MISKSKNTLTNNAVINSLCEICNGNISNNLIDYNDIGFNDYRGLFKNLKLCFSLYKKAQLQYSYLGYWLIFPLTYAAYTMSHGKWTKFYPYEFTNVQALGLNRVLLNGLVLSISLLVGGALFIFLGKLLVSSNSAL